MGERLDHPSLGAPIMLQDLSQDQFDLGLFLRSAMKLGLIELGEAMVISSAVSLLRDAFEGEITPDLQVKTERQFGLITKERLLDWKGMV